MLLGRFLYSLIDLHQYTNSDLEYFLMIWMKVTGRLCSIPLRVAMPPAQLVACSQTLIPMIAATVLLSPPQIDASPPLALHSRTFQWHSSLQYMSLHKGQINEICPCNIHYLTGSCLVAPVPEPEIEILVATVPFRLTPIFNEEVSKSSIKKSNCLLK